MKCTSFSSLQHCDCVKFFLNIWVSPVFIVFFQRRQLFSSVSKEELFGSLERSYLMYQDLLVRSLWLLRPFKMKNKEKTMNVKNLHFQFFVCQTAELTPSNESSHLLFSELKLSLRFFLLGNCFLPSIFHNVFTFWSFGVFFCHIITFLTDHLCKTKKKGKTRTSNCWRTNYGFESYDTKFSQNLFGFLALPVLFVHFSFLWRVLVDDRSHGILWGTTESIRCFWKQIRRFY